MKTRKTNEEAIERFTALVREIQTALTELKNANEEHYSRTPEEIQWGHVGDANRVLADLNAILDYVRPTMEKR